MINERELILDLASRLPTKVIDGKEVLDFKTSEIIPFVLGIVIFGDEVLLMKRSNEVGSFMGLWHIFAGHYDENVDPQEKLLEEFHEEAAYEPSDFDEIVKKDNVFIERQGKQNWLLIPFICRIKSKKEVVLNWESTDSKWVKIGDLTDQEGMVPGIAPLVKQLLK